MARTNTQIFKVLNACYLKKQLIRDWTDIKSIRKSYFLYPEHDPDKTGFRFLNSTPAADQNWNFITCVIVIHFRTLGIF